MEHHKFTAQISKTNYTCDLLYLALEKYSCFAINVTIFDQYHLTAMLNRHFFLHKTFVVLTACKHFVLAVSLWKFGIVSAKEFRRQI